MTHDHTYHLACDTLLSLPTTEQLVEKWLLWVCDCGQYVAFDGEFPVGVPLTLTGLMARHRQEKSDTSALARAVRGQEAGRKG